MAQYSGMLPSLGRNQGMGNINTRGMLPALGPGGGMNSSAGRGGYRDTGIRADTFDYIAQRDRQRARPQPETGQAKVSPIVGTFQNRAQATALQPATTATSTATPTLTPETKPIKNPGWGTPGYKNYIAQLPQQTPTASSGAFIDPATGRMLRAPTTPAELAQAEMEARNAALTGQTRSLEANINRGTEELSESEREARRQGAASAAAAGVTNASDMQGGMQALGSKYAGMRANLARDLRAQQSERQRTEDASMFGRLYQYGELSRAQELAELENRMQNGNSGSGSGGSRGIEDLGWQTQMIDWEKGKGIHGQFAKRRPGGIGGPSDSARDLEQDVINRSRQLQASRIKSQNLMNMAGQTARWLGGLG